MKTNAKSTKGRPKNDAGGSKPIGGGSKRNVGGPTQVGGVRTNIGKRQAVESPPRPNSGKRPAVEGALNKGKGIDLGGTLNPKGGKPRSSSGALQRTAVEDGTPTGDGSPPSVRSNPTLDVSPTGSVARRHGDQTRLMVTSREGDGSSSNASNRSSQATVSVNRTTAPRQFGLSFDPQLLRQQRSPLPVQLQQPPVFQPPLQRNRQIQLPDQEDEEDDDDDDAGEEDVVQDEGVGEEVMNQPGHNLEDFDQELYDLLRLPGRENLTPLSPHPIPEKSPL
ncbi:hypothetical protein AALP_AA4G116200, partial [Arabis alpina]